MKIKINEAIPLVLALFKAGLVPMIHGSPAIGKSAIMAHIAKKYHLKLIDMRLSQSDPTDLSGMPWIENGRASYTPLDFLPLEGDPIPEGYKGWLLFLDEANSAPTAVQAASYKLILDRMVGMRKLHPNVVIAAAGNLETDGAIVTPTSTAMQSRLVHLEVEPDLKSWLDWAVEEKFHYLITSYLEFRPDHLYTFVPDHTDKTYASPRTWEFTNRILKEMPISKEVLPLLIGTLGEGIGREFFGYCSVQDRLPKMTDVETNPTGFSVPTEPSVLYALSGAIAANTTSKSCQAFMEAVRRLPAEFQVTCVRNIIRRDKAMLRQEPLQDWMSKSSAELF